MPNRQELASQLSRLGLALQATSGSPTIANRAQTSLDRLGQNDARLLEQQLQNEAAIGMSRERSQTDFLNRATLNRQTADLRRMDREAEQNFEVVRDQLEFTRDSLVKAIESDTTDPKALPELMKELQLTNTALNNPIHLREVAQRLAEDPEIPSFTGEGVGDMQSLSEGTVVRNRRTGETEVAIPKTAAAERASDRDTETYENPLTQVHEVVVKGSPRETELIDAKWKKITDTRSGELNERIIKKTEVDRAIESINIKRGLPSNSPRTVAAVTDTRDVSAMAKLLPAYLANEVANGRMSESQRNTTMLTMRSRMVGLQNMAGGLKRLYGLIRAEPGAFATGKKLPAAVAQKVTSAWRNIFGDTDSEDHKDFIEDPTWNEQIADIAGGDRAMKNLVTGLAISYAKANGLINPTTGRITNFGLEQALDKFKLRSFNGDVRTFGQAVQETMTQTSEFVSNEFAENLGEGRPFSANLGLPGTSTPLPAGPTSILDEYDAFIGNNRGP